MGKTLELLALIVLQKEEAAKKGRALGPTLLICPAAKRMHWTDEIARHTNPPLKMVVGNKKVLSEVSRGSSCFPRIRFYQKIIGSTGCLRWC
jgi:SNF2 family DNA or RNA helicase